VQLISSKLCYRTTGVSLGSMAARVGGMVSPFILQAQTTIPWLTQVTTKFIKMLPSKHFCLSFVKKTLFDNCCDVRRSSISFSNMLP